MELIEQIRSGKEKFVLMVKPEDTPEKVAEFINYLQCAEVWVRGPTNEVLIKNPCHVNSEDVEKAFFWFGKPIQDT